MAEIVSFPEKEVQLSLRIKGKVKGWLRRPGEFYLGKSSGYAVITFREEEPIDLRDRRSVTRAAERARSVDQTFERIRNSPYLVLVHVPPHSEIRKEGVFRRSVTVEVFEKTAVSEVLPQEGDRDEVKTLSIIEGERPMISSRTDLYRAGGGGEKVLFTQVDYQYRWATIEDLKYFDQILEDPGTIL